jgi:hypothetical protein
MKLHSNSGIVDAAILHARVPFWYIIRNSVCVIVHADSSHFYTILTQSLDPKPWLVNLLHRNDGVILIPPVRQVIIVAECFIVRNLVWVLPTLHVRVLLLLHLLQTVVVVVILLLFTSNSLQPL